MADLWKGRGHSVWSASDQVDLLRPSCGNSSASSSCSGDGNETSRCSIRRFKDLLVERKAYPLPHPMQFEKLSVAGSPASDPAHGTLRPTQPLMRYTEEARRNPREEENSAKAPSQQRSTAAMEQPTRATDNQPSPLPSLRDCSDRAGILESCSSAEVGVLGFLHERDAAVKKTEASSRVVVVYDGKKKFTTAPLDIAIKGYATSEGDAIVVVAFLEHVRRPMGMGMKMVADMEQFSGVNDAVLKQAVYMKKMEIESKLREASRLQWCQMKKIRLDVKVLAGSNAKALVAKEISTFTATSVIFDKNAMKNRKYYEENLSCHVLRLRSDGRSVETIALFGQRLDRAGSATSYCSDSSTSSVGSEPACNSPSIWSKLNIFGSKSSATQLRHRHGGQGSSTVSSSRTSSESGSPRASVMPEEDETTVSEALEESFSFDTPKPDSSEALEESFSFDTPKLSATHEAYVYAAAGLDDYSRLHTRRNRETLSTALVA